MAHSILAEVAARVSELKRNPMATVAAGVRLWPEKPAALQPFAEQAQPLVIQRGRYMTLETIANLICTQAIRLPELTT